MPATNAAAVDQILTPERLANHAAGLSKTIGETVRCEKIGSMVYTFGSELAALKVFRMYNMQEGCKIIGRVGKSDVQGHYFVFETKY